MQSYKLAKHILLYKSFIVKYLFDDQSMPIAIHINIKDQVSFVSFVVIV